MLELKGVSVWADEFRVEDVSLEIPSGCCGVLMGPSGAGKSTLMEAVCGLRPIRSGCIVLAGRAIEGLRPGHRGIGWVPQDTMLFPHMPVREQLAFGPEVRAWEKSAIAERIESLANRLGIDHLLDRRPEGLSGGEAKRVGIGRALAARPQLLCLDESLTGLDEETHREVMEVIKRVVLDEKVTTLLITHRREEAEALGDVRFELRGGHLLS